MFETFFRSVGEIVFELAKKSVNQMSDSPKGVVWTWDTIKGFGQAKALRASYLFLFLVPILAKLLGNIPPTVLIPIFQIELEIPLALPFSWYVFFMSACFASIGNMVYSIFCPDLIKNYEDYIVFDEHARDGTYLRAYVKRLSFLHSDDELHMHVEATRKLYNSIPIDIQKIVEFLDGNIPKSSQGFYFVRDAVNLSQPLIRLFASIFYFAAFACLGYIVVENIGFVASSFGITF